MRMNKTQCLVPVLRRVSSRVMSHAIVALGIKKKAQIVKNVLKKNITG